MDTNDDIVRAKVPAYIKDTLNLFQKEIQQGETDYFGMLTRLAVIIDIKAKANIAKQIFKKLESINKKTLYSNQKRVGSYIQIKKDDYIALKKEYNIED